MTTRKLTAAEQSVLDNVKAGNRKGLCLPLFTLSKLVKLGYLEEYVEGNGGWHSLQCLCWRVVEQDAPADFAASVAEHDERQAAGMAMQYVKPGEFQAVYDEVVGE